MSKYRHILLSLIIIILFSFSHAKAFASELILRKNLPIRTDMYFSNVAKIPDPTTDPKTIYGYLGTSYAADSYYFIPSQSTTISIEVLVPVRSSNERFKPGWEIVGENIPPQPMNIYFSVPPGSDFIGHDYYVDMGTRSIVSDPVTVERLYSGNKQQIKVIKDNLYYINIYDPFHYTGDYVLKIGNRPDYMPVLQNGFIKDLYQIKTNQFGKTTDNREIIAFFFCIVGLVMAASSLNYTKMNGIALNGNRVFTLGTALFIFAQMYLYRQSLFSGIALIQLVCVQATIILYILYKIFLKPYLYFLVSASLLGQIFLFVWYLLVTR